MVHIIFLPIQTFQSSNSIIRIMFNCMQKTLLEQTFRHKNASPGVTATTGKAKQMFIKANYQKRTIISTTNLSCSDSNASELSS